MIYYERKTSMITRAIYVTKKCNMECKHCYVDDKTIDFSIDELLEAVDIYYDNDKDNVTNDVMYEFLGGEPLLVFDKIKVLIDYIKSKYTKKKVHFVITTNGTLLNSEMMDFIESNKDILDIAISLDGYNFSNQLRIMKDDKNSFNIVINNIKKLEEINILPIIHMVITPYNINRLVDDIFQLNSELHIKYFDIGIIESTMYIDEEFILDSIKELDTLSKALISEPKNIRISIFENHIDNTKKYIVSKTGKVLGEIYGNSKEIGNIFGEANIQKDYITVIRNSAYLNNKLNELVL